MYIYNIIHTSLSLFRYVQRGNFNVFASHLKTDTDTVLQDVSSVADSLEGPIQRIKRKITVLFLSLKDFDATYEVCGAGAFLFLHWRQGFDAMQLLSGQVNLYVDGKNGRWFLQVNREEIENVRWYAC